MKQLVLIIVVAVSLALGGVAFADEQKQAESTIVGPVMENRYVSIMPEDEQPALSEPAKKLMDQGVIPAVEDARVNTQTTSPVKK